MIEIGDKVPNVTLPSTEFKLVELPKASSGRPTILAFFPGAFTGVCTKEMCTFRDALSGLSQLGATLYAISVDSPFSNKEFKAKNNLNFDILSDYNREAVRAFGVELKDFAHLKGYTAAKRSVFITDASGAIRFKWVTEDPAVEPDYDAIRKAVEGLSGAPR